MFEFEGGRRVAAVLVVVVMSPECSVFSIGVLGWRWRCPNSGTVSRYIFGEMEWILRRIGGEHGMRK